MKLFYSTILFVLISIQSFAQFDVRKSSSTSTLGNKINKKPSYLTPSKKASTLGNTSRIDGLSLYKKKDTAKLAKSSKKNTGMSTDNGLLKREGGKTPKWFSEDSSFKKEYNKGQYLGDFKNNGKFVQVFCRDHQFVDGDRIKVYVNDKVIEANIVLDGSFKGFDVFLEKGFNRIDFQALNQGSSGPNTAEFKVYDENGQLISSDVWNLATGAKATMIIVKD